MTPADILLEYRQIRALEYEDKTGKPVSEHQEARDPEYEAWQASIGVNTNQE